MGDSSIFSISWGIAGVAFAFVLFQIVSAWLFRGLISLSQAAMMLGIVGLLVWALWVSQDQLNGAGMLAYVALSVGVAGATRLIYVQHERRLLRALREESMAQYRAVLKRDPKNAAAHAYLGDSYQEMGQYDEAIAEYQAAIDLDPEGSRRERSRQFQAYQAKARAESGPMVKCYECRADSPRGSRICVKCGASLNTSFFVWLFTPANLIDVLARSAIPILVVLVLFGVFWVMPLPVKGCIIGAIVLLLGYVFLRNLQQNS